MKTRLIDLSHTIEDGLITYKGLPAPIICDYLTRKDSKKIYQSPDEFHIAKIEMVGNTGTYMDCPLHRYETGKDFTEFQLESFFDLEAILISVPHKQTLSIGLEHFENLELKNKAVLIHTGWDKYWNTDKYFTNHPYITAEAAEYLKKQSVKLVGIDSHNIDNTNFNLRPVHSTLLRANILIVEHLCNLQKLSNTHFTFTAIPPKIKGTGTFPVRAIGKML
ncbi:cyclase family protein [Flavobacterium sp. CYK-4]|uniref:cyclase family protein n=1 Tax=Flavobacterium lotistagni TaxID=2709660 RepID=UPI001408DE92|nr:cyclase family protein [Flavobacterium lotistagni]NHM07593.1 cyclase family protein [Flavobacterium lotistagni]